MTASGKRWLRRIGLALALLVALAAAALFAGEQLARQKMQRKIDIPVKGVAFRDDAAAIERGRYLFASRGCVDCHGAHGGGKVVLDDGKGMLIKGPNLSPGPGSVVAGYTAADWERSIRHGVNPVGRALMVMPSEDYNPTASPTTTWPPWSPICVTCRPRRVVARWSSCRCRCAPSMASG